MNEGPATFEKFRALYDERLKQVYGYWNPRMQDEIGAHCAGWRSERFDFGAYLSRSVLRSVSNKPDSIGRNSHQLAKSLKSIAIKPSFPRGILT